MHVTVVPFFFFFKFSRTSFSLAGKLDHQSADRCVEMHVTVVPFFFF